MHALDNEFRRNGLPLVRHPFLIIGSLDPGRPVPFRDTEGATAAGVLSWGGSTLWECLPVLPEWAPPMCWAPFGHQGESFKRGWNPCPLAHLLSWLMGCCWHEVGRDQRGETAPPAMPTLYPLSPTGLPKVTCDFRTIYLSAGDSVVKNSPAGGTDSIPGWGRFPWRRKW